MNFSPWIDQKYINFVISRLDQGSKIKQNEWVARCPVCGDSKKSQFKRRFHISFAKGEYLCHCFNCDYAASFYGFLKDYFPDLYKDYKFEKIKEDGIGSKRPKRKKSNSTSKVLLESSGPSKVNGLIKIRKGDLAYTYLESRHVQEYVNKYFFYTDNFQEFINKFRKDKEVFDGPSIVVPLLDFNKQVIGFQARVLPKYQNKARQRYYTIRIKDESRVMFVPLHVDLSKRFYVVEGIFDALMLPNAIANLSSALHSLKKHMPEEIQKNAVYFYDNEPRHKEIMRLLKKTARKDCVVIPDNKMSTKDLNEWIVSGKISKQKLAKYVQKRTFCPPKSLLVLVNYVKA